MTKIERQNALVNPKTLEPRYVRCYDNGGETWDRFTVVFTGNYRKGSGRDRSWFQYVGMSSNPYSPQGFCQHGENQSQIDVNASGFAPAIGRKNHLGVRIAFDALPDDCKSLVLADYCELWGLSGTC